MARNEGVRRLSLAAAAVAGTVVFVYHMADESVSAWPVGLGLAIFSAGAAWASVRLVAWVIEGFGTLPPGKR